MSGEGSFPLRSSWAEASSRGGRPSSMLLYGSFTDTNTDEGTLWDAWFFSAPVSGSPYTLTAGTGAYTLSGKTAGLTATRTIALATGSYALTGVAASLVWSNAPVATGGPAGPRFGMFGLGLGGPAGSGPFSGAATPSVRIVAIIGDSNSVGRGTSVRTAADVDQAGVYQLLNNASVDGGSYHTISSDITPLHHPDATVPANDRIGPGEQLGRSLKDRYTAAGLPDDIIFLVPSGIGGQSVGTAGETWNPDAGGAAHTSYDTFIASVTAAETAAAAQWPTYTLVREMVYWDGGANDVASLVPGTTFLAGMKNIISTFRTTDKPTWSAVRWVIAGLPFDDALLSSGPPIERALQQLVAEVSNVYYVKSIDDSPDDGDVLHRIPAANRDIGNKAALIDTDTTAPVWTCVTTRYNATGKKLQIDFTGDYIVSGTQSGGALTLDADTEVGNVFTTTRSIRWTSDGTKAYVGGANVFTPPITIIGGNRQTAVVNLTITVADVSGVDPGLVIPSGTYGFYYDAAKQTTADQSQDNSPGTTAVAVNAVVGRIVDSSPNAIVLTQATAANKPLLRSASGVDSWEADGTNDILFGTLPTVSGVALSGFGKAQAFTVVALLKSSSAALSKVIVGEASSSSNTPFYHPLFKSASDTDTLTSIIRSDSSGGFTNPPIADVFFDGTWKIATIQYGGPGTTCQIRVNGGAWSTTTPGTNTGPFSVDRLGMFGSPIATPGSFFTGQLSAVWGIASVATEGELAIAEQKLAARAGITLP